MITDINSEDRLVQQTFAAHLETALGWNSVCAYNFVWQQSASGHDLEAA